MAMARPGGIHGVMEVKKEDHWAGALNHSLGDASYSTFQFLCLSSSDRSNGSDYFFRKPRREIDPT